MLNYENYAGEILENEQAAISLATYLYAKLHCRFLHAARFHVRF